MERSGDKAQAQDTRKSLMVNAVVLFAKHYSQYSVIVAKMAAVQTIFPCVAITVMCCSSLETKYRGKYDIL